MITINYIAAAFSYAVNLGLLNRSDSVYNDVTTNEEAMRLAVYIGISIITLPFALIFIFKYKCKSERCPFITEYLGYGFFVTQSLCFCYVFINFIYGILK